MAKSFSSVPRELLESSSSSASGSSSSSGSSSESGSSSSSASSASSSSSSSSDCHCDIKWADGTEITDQNRNVLPGHQINLKIFCEDAPAITDIIWELPGKVFKSYTITQDNGTLTELVPADLESITVQFYWADVGDSRTVKVTFKADGVDCDAEALFNVKDPIVEFPIATPPIGNIRLDPPTNPTRIALLDATTTNTNGVIFEARVIRPTGFSFAQAEWEYGQISPAGGNRTWRRASDGTCFQVKWDSDTNDNPWPYAKGASPGAPPWPDGNTFRTVVDTPNQALDIKDQLRWEGNHYSMYIMFKPAPDPPGAGASAWVPLRRCNWLAVVCAEKNVTWTIVSKGVGIVSWVEERTHPQWDQKWSSIPIDQVQCPGPCQ